MNRLPLHLPGFETEYAAAKNRAVLIDLSSRGKIRVTGADRILVLHRLLTHDIKSLSENSGCHAAFLNAQGKILADMHLYRLAQEVLLDVETGLETKLVEILNRFIITEEMLLVPAGEEIAHLALWGPSAEKVLTAGYGLSLQDLKPHGVRKTGQNTLILKKKLGDAGWWELLIPAADAEKETTRLLDLGLVPAGEQTWEALRIETGSLRYGRDMDETVTLPETGLDQTAASETKGCYPGQEVVARTNTYQGHAKKMTRLEWLGANVPVPGEKIYSGETEAGWITSASASPQKGKGFALGYLLKPYFLQSGPFKTRTAVLHSHG